MFSECVFTQGRRMYTLDSLRPLHTANKVHTQTLHRADETYYRGY